jgi:hypothetical protein
MGWCDWNEFNANVSGVVERDSHFSPLFLHSMARECCGGTATCSNDIIGLGIINKSDSRAPHCQETDIHEAISLRVECPNSRFAPGYHSTPPFLLLRPSLVIHTATQ